MAVDGSDEVVGLFPMTSGAGNVIGSPKKAGSYFGTEQIQVNIKYDSGGSAARFFYTAKSSRNERTCGGTVENGHPTCKPLSLMRYLCRLTKTPTGGTVLDPFMGSGTTGIAAIMEGRSFIGIEKEEEYMNIAKARIQHAQPGLL